MNQKKGNILVIDDNEDILFAIKLLLKPIVAKITTYLSPKRIPEAMAIESFDVIILDMNYTEDTITGNEGFEWLKRILEIDPKAVVIFITAHGDTEKAVNAIKSGASDFILKPWRNEKLIATVSSGIELAFSRKETHILKSRQKEISAILDQPFHDFIGESAEMNKVFELISKVSKTDANVLILGENGTGKELVARAIYRNSLRNEDVFVSVDLGSIAETLFESELFGHEKGAFTDALNEKPGRFEIANGGTLFLDELGNLSLPMQQKLLTVIERREVTRVGANKSKNVDVRLISATNGDLHQMVVDGKFRQDLLYRINTVEVYLPPLRDRKGDIEVLANHFLKIYAKKYKRQISKISSQAIKSLNQYTWPGNVRELQHSIERAIIMSDSQILDVEDFVFNKHKNSAETGTYHTFNLEEVEQDIIKKVLKMNSGNISVAAETLGITRASLYRRMEKYGI